MTISGTVTRGVGMAFHDMAHPIYRGWLPWEPERGTLNLAVRPGATDQLPRPHIVVPFDHNPLQVWHARLRRIADPVAVMVPLADDWPPDRIELLAPVHLRSALGVDDGDIVEVTIVSNPFDELTPRPGTALEPGRSYHDIPGVDSPADRQGTEARVAQIVDALGGVDGKSGLDLGCAVGGISIGLALAGARMFGIDSDPEAIAVARHFATDLRVDAEFEVADLTSLDTWERALGAPDARPDFVVWLSNWMWIAHYAGPDWANARLRQIADSGATLVFETAEAASSMAGNHGVQSAADVRGLLTGNGFGHVMEVGATADGWHGRHVFVARRDLATGGVVLPPEPISTTTAPQARKRSTAKRRR